MGLKGFIKMVIKPKVYRWNQDLLRNEDDLIDTDNIVEVSNWCREFSGNHRLPTDVGLPLERAVVGSYQIGYVYDYLRMKDQESKEFKSYMEEGIASILIHFIASYEMMARDFDSLLKIGEFDLKWSSYPKYFSMWLSQDCKKTLSRIAENAFKYQRWVLYSHMHRTKRWDECAFETSLRNMTIECLNLIFMYNLDLSMGFALAMEKIQDGEIRRH
jgi:hypothetical protein